MKYHVCNTIASAILSSRWSRHCQQEPMLHLTPAKFADKILEWKVTWFTIIYLTFHILKDNFYQHNKDEDLLRNMISYGRHFSMIQKKISQLNPFNQFPIIYTLYFRFHLPFPVSTFQQRPPSSSQILAVSASLVRPPPLKFCHNT